jgi:hypothetical protein
MMKASSSWAIYYTKIKLLRTKLKNSIAYKYDSYYSKIKLLRTKMKFNTFLLCLLQVDIVDTWHSYD